MPRRTSAEGAAGIGEACISVTLATSHGRRRAVAFAAAKRPRPTSAKTCSTDPPPQPLAPVTQSPSDPRPTARFLQGVAVDPSAAPGAAARRRLRAAQAAAALQPCAVGATAGTGPAARPGPIAVGAAEHRQPGSQKVGPARVRQRRWGLIARLPAGRAAAGRRTTTPTSTRPATTVTTPPPPSRSAPEEDEHRRRRHPGRDRRWARAPARDVNLLGTRTRSS